MFDAPRSIKDVLWDVDTIIIMQSGEIELTLVLLYNIYDVGTFFFPFPMIALSAKYNDQILSFRILFSQRMK